jgi:2'-5' RNA ligase
VKSALLIPVPGVESLVGAHRLALDPTCALGMPAHITLVTPFAPPPISAQIIAELARIMRVLPAIALRFEAVGRFPQTVYLKPEPAGELIRLIETIVARYPQWPPYGGSHPDIVPHLTVADRQADPVLLDELAVQLRKRLPVQTLVREAWLMHQDADDRWRQIAALPFG